MNKILIWLIFRSYLVHSSSSFRLQKRNSLTDSLNAVLQQERCTRQLLTGRLHLLIMCVCVCVCVNVHVHKNIQSWQQIIVIHTACSSVYLIISTMGRILEAWGNVSPRGRRLEHLRTILSVNKQKNNQKFRGYFILIQQAFLVSLHRKVLSRCQVLVFVFFRRLESLPTVIVALFLLPRQTKTLPDLLLSELQPFTPLHIFIFPIHHEWDSSILSWWRQSTHPSWILCPFWSLQSCCGEVWH